MDRHDHLDTDTLRAWLEHVNRPRTVRLLMMTIAHREGAALDDVTRWYGADADELRGWMAELAERPTVAIAEAEGIDFDDLASSAGLTEATVREWFAGLADRPVETAADVISRYGSRQRQPIVSTTDSRVHFLDHAAIEANGWSIDDPDLFEKASAAGLPHDAFGRVLVEAGQTILDAVERRGMSWPYACRGGACANCAVFVLEGDIAMPGQTVLTDRQVRVANARLTCVGVPVTEEVKLVMNVQHLDEFADLRLPSPTVDREPVI